MRGKSALVADNSKTLFSCIFMHTFISSYMVGAGKRSGCVYSSSLYVANSRPDLLPNAILVLLRWAMELGHSKKCIIIYLLSKKV